jgi:hypothetical protein
MCLLGALPNRPMAALDRVAEPKVSLASGDGRRVGMEMGNGGKSAGWVMPHARASTRSPRKSSRDSGGGIDVHLT